MVTKEIERLRSSIQLVCRSSLPLGKIMDYIQEDMDAMQAELLSWRRENKEHAQALLQEQRFGHRIINTLFNLCAVSNTRSHTHTHTFVILAILFLYSYSQKKERRLSVLHKLLSHLLLSCTQLLNPFFVCACCRATDRAVEPLKAELAELEQLIKDQQDKICAVRSNILKNEEKIQKMVTGIKVSSRT